MEGGLDLLPGQRFCPMEDELVRFYLEPKVNGKPVPGNGDVIYELDLYGDKDPWKIWEEYEPRRVNDLRRSKDLYFFTKTKTTTAKSSRVKRTVGNGGTWKGQTAGKEVFLLDENQQKTTTLLGCKKTYTYKKEGSVHDGRWIMYEFELHKSRLKKGVKNDYVLCVLRKNDVLPEKKRKRQQEEEMSVEEDDGDNAHPHEDEEPQEKRQRLLPSSEAEQEQFLQPAALPIFQHEPVFLQDGEFMEWQESDLATLQEFMQDQSGAEPAEPEAEQVYLQDAANSSGVQQLEEAAPQVGQENLGQQLIDASSWSVDEIMSLVERGENLGDAMLGENWLESFAKELMDGEQPNTMEEGEGNALVYPDFDEQVSLPLVDENSGLKRLQAEPQLGQDNLEQPSDAVPLFAAQEISSGIDQFYPDDENPVHKVGAEANVMHGWKLGDVMIGENLSMEEMTRELRNDEFLNSIPVGDYWNNAGLSDFDYSIF